MDERSMTPVRPEKGGGLRVQGLGSVLDDGFGSRYDKPVDESAYRRKRSFGVVCLFVAESSGFRVGARGAFIGKQARTLNLKP